MILITFCLLYSVSVEALGAFKANPERFDLVITDIAMPNMTGIQLAQRIKNINANIPIIICTGFGDQITDEKCRALGFQGYVMKPLLLRDLAETIRKIINKTNRSE